MDEAVTACSVSAPHVTPPRSTLGLAGWRAAGRLSIAGAFGLVSFGISAAAFAAAPSSLPVPPAYNALAFGIDAGMPSNVAESVVQTRDGYLWTGTEGGLARFDGVRIVTFRVATTPALGSNLIRCLIEDASGTLWIGTQNGLCRYFDRHFERIPGIDVPVADLACDNHGRLWIATLGAGVLELRDGRLISHAGDPGLPATRQALRLFHDSTDRIWIGFRDGGLASYGGGTFRTEAWADGNVGEISRIGEAPAGTFWFGTPRGVLRRRKGSSQQLGPEQGLPVSETASAFFTDAQGHFWIVIHNLYRAETADADAFANVSVATPDQCRSIMQDREGSYWLGTSGTGIIRMRPSAFRVFFPGQGNIQSVARGADDSAWVAPVGRQVVQIGSDGELTQLALRPAESANILSLLFDSGRLWIGTRDGLCVWEKGQLRRYPVPGVRVIYQDRQGALWLGSGDRGVLRYRNGAFESMGETLGTGVFSATAFGEDAAGTLYIGLDQGLVAFRDGKAAWLVPDPVIPEFRVRSIYSDASGDLWIGTKLNGLVLYQGNRWYDGKGLAETLGEPVSAIKEDSFGRLWLGAARGIIWGKKSDVLEAEHGKYAPDKFRVVGKNEGVEPSNVGYGSQPVSFTAADGSIWFATRTGVVSVRPDKIAFNAAVPPVWIERVQVDGIPAPSSDEIHLPAGTHDVAVDYTALSFVRPDAVFFRYRLQGRDAGWIDAGPRRTAFYADLKPGRYKFEVIACNNDGVWNETGAKLTLVQRPWFYQTWWFYGFAGLLIAGLAGGLHWMRTAILRRENERLEKGIAERTSELVESEKALRISQEKFSKAFHTQPDAIAISRLRDGVYLEINTSFTRVTGYTAEDILGRTPLPGDLGIWTDAADRERLVAAIGENGEVSGFESSFRRKDGTVFNGVLSARIMEIGGVTCMLSITRDVTDQKQLEDQLQHAQKMEAVGQLAGGVAHDYNNILTSTLMQLGLLLRNPALSPDIRPVLGELEKDANRAASLTRQLLAFSRRQVIQVKCVELNGMLENLFTMLCRLLGEAVQLEFLPSPAPLRIKADVGMIEQVVTNLCVNARDALGPRGGRLEIETSLVRLEESAVRSNPEARPGLFACLRVMDTGCGMSPVTLKHLFEPFFTTKEFGKGTGLGLAIIYGIIKQHQGWIEVESELGRSSTFRIFLPAQVNPPAESTSAAAPIPGGGHETILLVEDEVAVRKTVCLALQLCGYHILEAGDGEEAIRIWSEHRGVIDLLLSDMVMPKGISGLDLAERFRQDRPELKVIISSGYSVDLQKAGALAAARTAYLAKPYDLATLAAAIRKCLDES